MKKFLFYFALTAWIVGIIVHILSLSGTDVSEKIPFVWLLHIGIFVVWSPVVRDLKENKELQEVQQSDVSNRKDATGFYKIVFKDTPTWMPTIIIGSFIYLIINFIIFAATNEGVPSAIAGTYILEDHGHFVKTLTESEYHYYKANELRGFSGHWIFFYGAATAILYKFSGQKSNEPNKP